MGGLGSGGHNAHHRGVVEAHRRLSANSMQKHGVFHDGWAGRWGWSNNEGETTGWIWIVGGRDELRLEYKFREGGGEWQEMKQTVFIVRVGKPFGGEQAYFFCPRCGARALHLYGSQAPFWCRACSRLVHASTRERFCDRAARRARKLRRRLGTDEGLEGVVRRPKHMRQHTFERVFDEIIRREADVWDDGLKLLARLKKIEGRVGRNRATLRSVPRRRFW